MNTTSQNAAIKADLLEGKQITQLYALNAYGCMRLASRIFDLRDAGLPVKTAISQGDKRYAVYYIDKADIEWYLKKQAV